MQASGEGPSHLPKESPWNTVKSCYFAECGPTIFPHCQKFRPRNPALICPDFAMHNAVKVIPCGYLILPSIEHLLPPEVQEKRLGK